MKFTASVPGLTIFLLSVAAAVAADTPAAGWWQFRGPAAWSAAPGGATPPVALEASQIVWKADLPGRGLSSPLVVGERLFLTAASGPLQETLHVRCVNAEDGSLRWDRRFQSTGRTMCHEKTCVAAPTPCTDGKQIYALYSTNDLVCLDLDGNVKWLRGLTFDYPNASNSLGMASSPILAGGVLVVQVENDSESFAAGLDTTTGVNLWKLNRPKDANWSSPVVWRDPADGQETVMLSSGEGVLALDPRTGRERWTLPKPGPGMSSNAVSPTHLAVPRPGSGMAVWSLKAGTTPPELIWESPQVNTATGSPVMTQDRLFAVNGAGVLTCAVLADGERPWKLRLEGPFSASPVLAGTTLYAVSERGMLQSVDTTAAEGAVTGKIELGETILATPSLAGRSLYVRSDGHLWKIGK